MEVSCDTANTDVPPLYRCCTAVVPLLCRTCRITPEGFPAVEASTATGAFALLWEGAEAAGSNRGKAVQRSGLEMFGLLHVKVARRLLDLPGADRWGSAGFGV